MFGARRLPLYWPVVSVFYFAESAQKIVRLAFLITHRFSFLFLLGSVAAEVRGRGSAVSGHIRYSGPEKICVSAVILSLNSLLCTVQDQSASAASETGEGEGEKLNQVGQVLSAPELPSSVLSLSLSLSLSRQTVDMPHDWV